MSDTKKSVTLRVQQLLKDGGADIVVDGDPGKNTMLAVESALKPAESRVSCEIIDKPLPSFCYSKRQLSAHDGIVIHYVSAIYSAPDKWDDISTIFTQTVELNKPGNDRGKVLPKDTSKRMYASYHYLIGRQGDVYSLAPLNRQAYHAGVSTWKGRDNCNRWTIGIALVGHGKSGYTEDQYTSLQALIETLQNQYTISEIFGHDECAPDRKQDPGKDFDWTLVR